MPTSLYEVLWIFIIYAFIGWCTEVSYAALDRGIFVNRGFLNGPYCPIYGIGVLTVVVVLTPLKRNLILLYLGSFFLTSILEYFTGLILEKVFHNKWWDYSDKPYNIKGYVCLKFSIFWGFACTFIMLIIHPIIYTFITYMPKMLGLILLVIILCVFVADCCVTVATILQFNKRLAAINEVSKKIHVVSDKIGENIYTNVTEAIEKKEKFEEEYEDILNDLEEKKENIARNVEDRKLILNENADELRGQLETLNEQYKKLLEEKKFGFERLLKAFPNMKSKEHDEMLVEMKNVHLKEIREKIRKIRKDNEE